MRLAFCFVARIVDQILEGFHRLLEAGHPGGLLPHLPQVGVVDLRGR
jgi:hypothetical protein